MAAVEWMQAGPFGVMAHFLKNTMPRGGEPGAGSYAYVTRDQDYLGGEANDLTVRAPGPLVDGMQWHSLFWLDCFWNHDKAPGEIPPAKYADAERLNYVSSSRARGAR